VALSFQSDVAVESWGRLRKEAHNIAAPAFADAFNDGVDEAQRPILACGNRRSYSDVCLNSGKHLVDMAKLRRFHSFDPDTGLLVADAGVSLADILKHFVPRGYFLPVTPGTQFVTLGGAVANDVHGKNHHRAGSFGAHVQALTIWRSDGGIRQVSRSDEPALFAATIGGMGLTGIILSVALTLQRVGSARLDVKTTACPDFDSLLAGLERDDADHEHNVAWIDCAARGKSLGRGIITAANWRADGDFGQGESGAGPVFPTDRLGGMLNAFTVRAFNAFYFANGWARQGTKAVDYAPYFYPLDRIRNWNRLYGRKGFYQYQCVIPKVHGGEPIKEMMRIISRSGEGSFLAVLKNFGKKESIGFMSFPMEGLTLALDFRNRGLKTLALFSALDAVVQGAGGRLYAAKDARMSGAMLREGYPNLSKFLQYLDPAIGSDFSRRVLAI
jgi:FAD/FMN-containing dehydrogenase